MRHKAASSKPSYPDIERNGQFCIGYAVALATGAPIRVADRLMGQLAVPS